MKLGSCSLWAALLAVACDGPRAPAGQENARSITFDDTSRAWVNPVGVAIGTDYYLYWQPKGGLQREILVSTAPVYGLELATEGLYYWAEGNLELYDPAAGTRTALYPCRASDCEMTLDGEFLYVTVRAPEEERPDGGLLPDLIEKIPRKGGTGTRLAVANDVFSLVQDEQALYWFDGGDPGDILSPITLWTTSKKERGTPQQLYSIDVLEEDVGLGPVLYAGTDKLYWVLGVKNEEYSQGRLYSMDKAGGTPTRLVHDHFIGAGSLWGFDTKGPRLFGVVEDVRIVEWPLQGGTQRTLATCRRFCGDFRVQGDQVVWADDLGLHPAF